MIIKTRKQTIIISYSEIVGGWVVIPVTHEVKGLSDTWYATRADAIQKVGEYDKEIKEVSAHQ